MYIYLVEVVRMTQVNLLDKKVKATYITKNVIVDL